VAYSRVAYYVSEDQFKVICIIFINIITIIR